MGHVCWLSTGRLQGSLLFLRSQLFRWGPSYLVRFGFVVVVVVVVVFNFLPDLLFFYSNHRDRVVSFRLRGWCMLGVLLLPVFIHLGHECLDLLSPCDGVHVCTRFILSSERVENGVRTHVNSKGKNPLYRKEGGTRDTASRWTASPTYYRLSYSGPRLIIWKRGSVPVNVALVEEVFRIPYIFGYWSTIISSMHRLQKQIMSA